ncbi:hypothetical protein CRV08_14915 [Halarcobacter ebronensis]|uniref:DUF218 domain-containing protein n=1 Tax=Halarcobacter ebronensis TaxID=1462615 RepID=A0A4V1LQR0_9BACT|nr:ElyC/SanA/YdcF family protein [Halarcobacter ebronensis]RXJ65568.1 hypothetical protein CRV08_14915 [Halarcobacter ebronensis]
MLFALKKLISIFFMPFSISMILLFIALFYLLLNRYTKAKFFLILTFLWTFLISYEPFSNSLVNSLETKYNSYLDIDSKIEYVLVLGNDHETDENRSVISQMSRTGLTRLNEGIRIYRKLENAKLIVSGYGGKDKTPHAIMAKNAALALGVEENNILTQEEAKDTIEEAKYAKERIGDKTFVLVTSASHMPRAMEIFKSFGLNPIAAPTDYHSKAKVDYLSFPKAANISKTSLAFHEYLGEIWFKFSQKINFYLN